MAFEKMWPFALLLLIPLIVILYLLKQKSVDYKVPSLYLWKEAYKNNTASTPFQKFRNNLLMYIQIITLIIFILALATPVIKNIGGNYQSVVIVIDSTASMQREYKDGKSRFDEAVDVIKDYVNNLSSNSEITVIATSDVAEVVVSNSDDKKKTISEINKLKCTDMSGDMDSALNLLTAIMNGNESSDVIIFTDNKEGISNEDYTVVDVSSNKDNMYVSVINYTESENGLDILVTIGNDSDKTKKSDINLYGDGKLLEISEVEVEANSSKNIIFSGIQFDGEILTAEINNKDAIIKDNSRACTTHITKQNKVLLITNQNIFLEKALVACGNVDLYKTNTADSYPDDEYDLYVFDGIEPKVLPQKGNLMFFNCDYDEWFGSESIDKGGLLTICNENYTSYLLGHSFGVSKMLNYTVPSWGNRILEVGNSSESQAGGVCAGFIGTFEGRNIVAIGFDLHNSEFPLDIEFPVFMKEIYDKINSASILSNTVLTVGDELIIYGVADGEAVNVYDYEKNKKIAEYESGTSKCYQNEVVGTYKVEQKNNETVYKGLYVVNFPVTESVDSDVSVNDTEGNISISDIKGDLNLRDYVIMISLLFLLIEWIIYLKRL